MAKKRKKIQQAGAVLELPEVSAPKSLFYDSGSFTLWTLAKRYGKANGCDEYDFYDTDEFWMYMHHYVHFIKKYEVAVDHYANIDVIPNPTLSWRNQQWLEKQGLKPVPVIHYTTPLHWLKMYIERGYDYLGLGGLVGRIKKASQWLDSSFNVICDQPSRLPLVRVHGFGVTQHQALWKYPWYSVDAASWGKMGAYGTVCIPRKCASGWDFKKSPLKLCVSNDSGQRFGKNHYCGLSRSERAFVDSWFEFIGVPLGEDNPDGSVKVPGVLNFHLCRRFANMHYFNQLTAALPEYPWPFQLVKQKGFGFIK